MVGLSPGRWQWISEFVETGLGRLGQSSWLGGSCWTSPGDSGRRSEWGWGRRVGQSFKTVLDSEVDRE